MVKGLRTPYKDEHGLALLQLGGRLLQSNKLSETIATCYAHTMLNLNFASSVNRCSVERTSFDKGWPPINGRFKGLCEFCARLAIVFPNIVPDKADFSVIGWENNDYRQNLTDFSFEGIIQAKQLIQMSAHIGLITSLWPPHNTTTPYVYYAFV